MNSNKDTTHIKTQILAFTFLNSFIGDTDFSDHLTFRIALKCNDIRGSVVF